MTIERRTLGTNGPSVSAIGLGLMSLSGVYGKADDDAGIRLIHAALDRGVDFLDSADMYGWGHNETLLGRAIKDRRKEVFLATKFGQTRTPTGNGVDGRPEYVTEACEASLKRLGVDVIDLYFQHRVDPNVPIEDTVGAMAQLVKQGKVRYLGLSEASPATIRRAHKTHPISAVETEYSLLYRKDAEESLVVTRELGIAFVAYSPLGRSLLTGTVHTPQDFAAPGDGRANHPRFQGGNLDHNRSLAAAVETLAAAKRCTPGQVALAWLLAQGPDIIPIPGTKRIERLDENLGALQVRLTADEVARLSAAIPVGAAKGTRYAESMMSRIQV